MKTNLTHYLSSIYFVNQPLQVSGNRQSTENPNTYQQLYIYSIPPDDRLTIYPIHAEAD